MPVYTDTYKTESKYLKVDDLQKKRVNLTIEKVVEETIGEQTKLVCEFKETTKKFVLNMTNCRMLEMLTDSNNTDDWENVRITLRPDITQFQNKPTPCIRIDSELPVQQTASGEVVPRGRGEQVEENVIPF